MRVWLRIDCEEVGAREVRVSFSFSPCLSLRENLSLSLSLCLRLRVCKESIPLSLSQVLDVIFVTGLCFWLT